MSFFDRFRRGNPPVVDTSTKAKPAEEFSALESSRAELFEYARQHSDELIKVKNAVANFLDSAGWQDGTQGQELARKYKNLEKEENVRERPDSFFSGQDAEVAPVEGQKRNRLEFLDWKASEDSEMSDDIEDYLETVTQEVRQFIQLVDSMATSIQQINAGGLKLNEGIKNETRRVLRDVQVYNDEDYDFNIFLANPRIRKILSEKGDQADLSVQKNTSNLRQEHLNLHRATQTLQALIR